nr:hypothetical protein [Tanacetum cinerariifolium]
MASSGPVNVIARRAIDEMYEFSGEIETPKYIKVFIMQEIVEARHFIRIQNEEAQTARSLLTQVRAMVAEMEALNDQDKYYDSLRCLRDNRRIREEKLKALNESIVAAKDYISVRILRFFTFLVVVMKVCDLEGVVYTYDSAVIQEEVGQSDFRLQLKEIGMWQLDAGCRIPRLPDKMKVVFSWSRSKDESFAGLMRDLCFSLRISLSKKRGLVAELEALGERGDVAKALEHLRDIVARDAVMLGELETVLTHAQVGASLKAGYVADVEKKELAFISASVSFYLS